MPITAKCLLCGNSEFPVCFGGSTEIDKCPKCGQAYYTMSGNIGGIKIDDSIVDNREIQEDNIATYHDKGNGEDV